MVKPTLVNLGCGTSFHESWLNFDLYSHSPAVRQFDLRRGIPLREGTCDAVYHSHFLEHLSQKDATRLMLECYRILKPGGVLRVVVPDLEGIVLTYLKALDLAAEGQDQFPYDLAVAELYDQTVRTVSGGALLPLIREHASGANRDILVARLGEESLGLAAGETPTLPRKMTAARLKRGLHRLRVIPLRALIRLLTGPQLTQMFDEAIFRSQGEIHRWMYDRFSLGRLLSRSGFESVAKVSSEESLIPGFSSYELDVGAVGVRKPDSLFMEALKPETK